MNRLRVSAFRATRCLALALCLVVVPSAATHAQMFGYGGMGYGGMGYGGMGYGGMGYGGMGYGGMGYGGMGYGGLGYGGMGYGGMGYGGLGYGGLGYGGMGYGGGYYYSGYSGMGYGGLISPYGLGYGYRYYNPAFGIGLTPLGIQSGLAETAIIRGSGGYHTQVRTVYPPVVRGRYGVYHP